MEIRLFIPNGYARDTGEAGGREGGAEGKDKGDVDEDVNAAQTFHDMIKEKAEIGQFTGERIALFEDINITTPRCVPSSPSLSVSARVLSFCAMGGGVVRWTDRLTDW